MEPSARRATVPSDLVGRLARLLARHPVRLASLAAVSHEVRSGEFGSTAVGSLPFSVSVYLYSRVFLCQPVQDQPRAVDERLLPFQDSDASSMLWLARMLRLCAGRAAFFLKIFWPCAFPERSDVAEAFLGQLLDEVRGSPVRLHLQRYCGSYEYDKMLSFKNHLLRDPCRCSKVPDGGPPLSLAGAWRTLAVWDFQRRLLVEAVGTARCIEFRKCSNLSFAEPLCAAKRLFFDRCRAANFLWALKNAQEVEVSMDSTVVALAELGTVRKLSLYNLPRLRDVSAVANVHDVTISECNALVDVSPLASVRRLSISLCAAVTDVAPLRSAHRLSIGAMHSVKNVHCLGGVPHLEIYSLPRVRSVVPFAACRVLILEDLPLVRNVDALATVERLTLRDLENVKSVDALLAPKPPVPRIRSLSVSWCGPDHARLPHVEVVWPPGETEFVARAE